jgi:surfactin synthase thioesterase subunit/glycosyltransferase involved in cell wall biosynthesis
MRVLLTSGASYAPPRGGSTRSNLAWLRTLVASGHECRVVAAADPQYIKEQPTVSYDSGVVILTADDPGAERELLRRQIAEFDPEVVLVSSEDLSHVLLREAHHSGAGPVVNLAHTPQFFPFGPESWNPDAQATDLVKRCAAIVAIGEHMAGYVERAIGVRPRVIHPPIYGAGPFTNSAAFTREFVTMINPSAVKGISIFLAAARALPRVHFAALPGWATTNADREPLLALSNVTVLEPVREIDDLLRRTRVLLMPSLWYEGFGLIVMEAMLRGIPVIASDSGGLEEAKRGTGYVIPVRPIVRYETAYDDRHMPRAVVPEQDVAPWIAAIEELTHNEAAWRRESDRSFASATRFVSALRTDDLGNLLESVARPRAMRILLAHNSLYFPSHGGGDKSNRLLMRALVEAGHTCLVAARIVNFGAAGEGQFVDELTARGVRIDSQQDGVVAFTHDGVEVRTAASVGNLRAWFASEIAAFRPDVILTSTDDPAQLMLEAALRDGHARVVYLVRATIALPFGPDAAFPSQHKTDVLRQVDGIVCVSEYVARYVREHSGMEAVALPISMQDKGPFGDLGSFDNEFAVMVNPCAVKGLPIFTALADECPAVKFAAVPTWGTTREDLQAIHEHPNIAVLEPSDDIDEILRRARVLLLPSMWAEARARIVVEAMLRGVPVLAANVGGIPEAMMGVPYLLPVNMITHYEPRVNEQMVPVAVIPPQDVAPWRAALELLTTDRAHWEAISALAKHTAREYVEKLSIRPFADHLAKLRAAPGKRRVPATVETPPDNLSPEKRKLLALMLRKRAAKQAHPWFPGIDASSGAGLRLFCFPYAGGGALTFRGWAREFGHRVAVCPVRLPGRETRTAEKPFERMEGLISTLGPAIRPFLDAVPFAFYGHSMGAGVAFELTRWLRRHGLTMPQMLIVGAARAPQLRKGWVAPAPPTDEVLEDLAGGAVTGALRADVELYRTWQPEEERPLELPIHAYAGADDERVSMDDLKAWREQTSARFDFTIVPGGHLFMSEDGFAARLRGILGGQGT